MGGILVGNLYGSENIQLFFGCWNSVSTYIYIYIYIYIYMPIGYNHQFINNSACLEGDSILQL